jgi:hypothetical protein
MRHLFIAVFTSAALLASGAFPGHAGAADVTLPPPGYGPPPSGYDWPPDHGAPPRVYVPRPSAYGPPTTMDREQTTVRHHGFMCHRRTQFRMPLRPLAPRVISIGDAVPGVADGGTSVTPEV